MRYLYAQWHDPSCRDNILQLAEIVNTEDLDKQLEHVIYKSFQDIIKESEIDRR